MRIGKQIFMKLLVMIAVAISVLLAAPVVHASPVYQQCSSSAYYQIGAGVEPLFTIPHAGYITWLYALEDTHNNGYCGSLRVKTTYSTSAGYCYHFMAGLQIGTTPNDLYGSSWTGCVSSGTVTFTASPSSGCFLGAGDANPKSTSYDSTYYAETTEQYCV